ncbi:hypothetical protein WISP_49407 [Willisornis vidua]|uniref:Uncharacterized protein n=1 Tax=Willisornis vidua TaxID=1566151 RepID=A0ABQ9DE55_9PASS|nr:hypothetical protein WISP_49407 [Willisornis vidua]
MQKRKVYAQWQQGQVTWEENTDSPCHCREKVCMAKAQLELNLPEMWGTVKKSFFKYINGNRQYRNTIGLLQEEEDRDKAEGFNTFFASVFNMDDKPRASQCPELEDHDWENDQLPAEPEIVQGLLFQLEPYKSMGPNGINPRILKELLMSLQIVSQ